MHKPQSSINSTFAPPTDLDTWYHRGEALANMGRYLEALDHFDQALALQPDYEKAWVYRAVVLIHLERSQEALTSCDRALQINPHSSEGWMFRGVALYRLSRYREAYDSYDRALGIQRQGFGQMVWKWVKRLGRFFRR